MEDRCVMCGEVIPEGLQVCPSCQRKVMRDTRRTAKYLRQYRDWEWMAANARQIIRECDDLMTKIGGFNTNVVDGTRGGRERLLDECIDRKNSVEWAVSYIGITDRAMAQLSDEERDLIYDFYIDRCGIRYIMRKHHYGRSKAYLMCSSALEHLDRLLYG